MIDRLHEELLEALPGLVAYVEGPEYVIRYANRRYAETVGGRPLVGLAAREAVPEAEAQGFIALLDQVRATGEPVVGREVKVFLERGPSGGPEHRWFDFTYQPVCDAAGAVVGIVAHAVDSTEAVCARQAQEDCFRQAVDSMLDSAMICSPVRAADGTVVDLVVEYVNPAAQDIATRPPEELLGRTMSEAWPNIVRSSMFELYRGVAETGEPVVVDSLAYDDVIDGVPVRGVFDVRAVRLDDRVFIVWRNVTERAARERELLEHREALAEAQRIAQVGSWRWQASDDTVTWSDEFFRICGFDLDEPPSRERFLSLLGPEGVQAVRHALDEAASTGASFQIEQVLTRPDGTRRTIVVTGEAAKDDAGVITMTKGTIQDVTDQRLVETALHHSELRLRQEHEAVKVLQAAILPKDLPEVPGASLAASYLAASEGVGVGGDWYDVFPLEGGGVLLTVGDVAGKGVQAAEAVAELRNGMRMAAVFDPRPAAVLAAVHRLVTMGFSAPFATAVVAVYDPATGRLEWASAGHPPLVHRSAEGEALLRGELPTRPPLGVGEGELREPYAVTLAPGDTVVLFTDGLVERRREALDERLHDLVRTVAEAGSDGAAQDLNDAVLEANLDPEGRQDDVCVLVLRRDPGFPASEDG